VSQEADRPAVEAQFRMAVQQPLRGAKRLPLSTYQANYDRALQRGMKPAVQAEGWLELEFQPAQLAGGAVAKSTMVLLFGRKDGGFWIGS
jgi:hypothetical protein